jgi:hypothetical protein
MAHGAWRMAIWRYGDMAIWRYGNIFAVGHAWRRNVLSWAEFPGSCRLGPACRTAARQPTFPVVRRNNSAAALLPRALPQLIAELAKDSVFNEIS